MRILCKYASAALLAALTLLLCACAGDPEQDTAAPTALHRILSTGTLRVVTCADFPPVIYKDEEGHYAGADYELCRYLAQRLEVELEIVDANLADFSTLLSQGEADIALGGIGVTAARQATMLLSEPYYSRKASDHVLVTHEYRRGKFKTPQDFEDVRVGVQKGSLQYDLVCEQLSGAQVILFSHLDEGQDLLEKGSIEVLATSGIIWDTMSEEYIQTEFTLTDDTQSYVIAAAQGEEEWLEEINRLAGQVLESDLYESWLEGESDE